MEGISFRLLHILLTVDDHADGALDAANDADVAISLPITNINKRKQGTQLQTQNSTNTKKETRPKLQKRCPPLKRKRHPILFILFFLLNHVYSFKYIVSIHYTDIASKAE